MRVFNLVDYFVLLFFVFVCIASVIWHTLFGYVGLLDSGVWFAYCIP